MRELVFIHGWGFDSSFWDKLSDLLNDFPQRRVDLGFFDGDTHDPVTGHAQILIGHSLGFLKGIVSDDLWAGWVAINSFGSFLPADGRPGCAEPTVLTRMKKRLVEAPDLTLNGFYRMIGASDHERPAGKPNLQALTRGLSDLEKLDAVPVLNRNRCPGLILASPADPLVPASVTEVLAHASLGAKCLWHQEKGHLLPLRDPVWCAEAIRAFC